MTAATGQAPRRARQAVLWLAVLAVGCAQGPAPPPRRDGGSTRAPAPAAPLDQAERQGPEAPDLGPDAGDIAAEVSTFDGLDRCRARLQTRLPPAVSEVLSDLGYRGATSDACLSLQALADRSPELCDRLEVRATREGCLRRYAMFHGEPDRCPVQLEYGGREPLCVAVAMRAPSMCASELDPARMGLCRAIVLRNARPCRVAHPTAVEAQRCAREASRWWGAVPPSRPRQSLPLDFAPSFTLCQGPAAPPDAGDACDDITALVRSGIVLRPEQGLAIGSKSPPLIEPRLPALELRVPLPAEGDALPVVSDVATDEVTAWLDLDPELLGSGGAECREGAVTLERFEPRRGAIVAGTYELGGCCEDEGDARRFHGVFVTFVRDVIREAPPRSTPGSAPE